MRTTLTITVLLLAALPALRADTAATVQKTLQASYDSRDKAVAKRDITATLALYAPDFVGVSQSGKTHGLAEERADFLKTFALPVSAGVTVSTIQKLTLQKAGSEAAVTLHRRGTLTLPDPGAHTSRIVVLDGVYQDVWMKRSGGWRLICEQVISARATVDGKLL